MIPRPILEGIGITYRRVPVISIGKDVYIDNHVTLQGLQSAFKDKALPEGPADYAFETFGYVRLPSQWLTCSWYQTADTVQRSFWMALPLVPAGLITKDLAKDRETLFCKLSPEIVVQGFS